MTFSCLGPPEVSAVSEEIVQGDSS